MASIALFIFGCGDKNDGALHGDGDSLREAGDGDVLTSDSIEIFLLKDKKKFIANTKTLGHVNRVSMPEPRSKAKLGLHEFSWDSGSEERLTLEEPESDAKKASDNIDIVELSAAGFFGKYDKACRKAIEEQVPWFDATQANRQTEKWTYVNWGNQFGQENRFDPLRDGAKRREGAATGKKGKELEEYRLISLMEDNLAGPAHGSERFTVGEYVVYMGSDGRSPKLAKVTKVQADSD